MDINKMQNIIKVLFEIIQEKTKISKINKNELNKITAEDSFIMGLNYLEEPISKFVENIDNIFDKNKSKNKMDINVGRDFSYILYENNLFNKTPSTEYVIQITKQFGVELDDIEGYYLNNIKDCVKYYMEIILSDYVNDYSKEKGYCVEEILKELYNEIYKEIINLQHNIDEEYKKLQYSISKIINQRVNEKEKSDISKYIDKKLKDL